MHDATLIYDFLDEAARAGRKTALVTIIAVTGASSRPAGAHMAVSEDGRYAGSLSGGCIEAAVVAEAVQSIEQGAGREVRFGEGSPYMDIRLPCGGGLDLLFTPLHNGDFIAAVLDRLNARRPLSIRLPRNETKPQITQNTAANDEKRHIAVFDDAVELTYIPPLRLAIFGHGAGVEALQRSAAAYGAQSVIFTPDAAIAERLTENAIPVVQLDSPGRAVEHALDRWTAEVFLFHDHDWEPHLMLGALARDAFFIGAMGSRATHRNRIEALRALGAQENAIARIHAPIGLIPSTRDPETLALSTLAQIVDAYQKRFVPAPNKNNQQSQ